MPSMTIDSYPQEKQNCLNFRVYILEARGTYLINFLLQIHLLNYLADQNIVVSFPISILKQGIFQIPVNNVVKPFLKVLYNLVVIKSTNTIRKGGYHEIYASSRFNSGCSYQYIS